MDEEIIQPSENNKVPETPKEKEDQAASVENLVSRYLKLMIWPVLIAAAFQISALHNSNEAMLIWVANAGLIALAVVYTMREKGDWQTSTIVAALTGGSTMLIVTLFELATNFSTILVFNVFTQSATTAVLDAIVAGFAFLITKAALDIRTKTQQKTDQGASNDNKTNIERG